MRYTKRQQQRIASLLARAKDLRLSRSAERRLLWFAFAAGHGGNVSLTCRHFGIARSTFLRWAERFNPRNERSLEDASRRPRHVRRPRTPEQAITLIAQWRQENPRLSRHAISQLLRAQGIRLSPASVGRVIARERLFFANTPSHQTKRNALPLSGTMSIERDIRAARDPARPFPLSPSLA
ncbi:MAG: helix-turn-helix domain-containing protein [Patescibacteria group bacterium]